MTIRIEVERATYLDSIFLMRLADRISHAPGVRRAAALMGTPANREALGAAGYIAPALGSAGPDDLVIAIDAESDDAANAAAAAIPVLLAAGTSRDETALSLDDAVRRMPSAALAVISVPGEHAAAAANEALDRGLHAFIFSSGVSVSDEIALKRRAHERGLLVMGPDCGTSIVGGVGLGFANAVRRGPIGVVGAAGTGIQELATLIHRSGSGISHAIGSGGRDLSDEVGGITTFDALDALAADAATRAIVVVSKPPGPRTLEALLERARATSKPVVVCAIGATLPARHGYARARTLDEGAAHALALGGDGDAVPMTELDPDRVRVETDAMRPEQRALIGLFAGGTLAHQARVILDDAGLPDAQAQVADLGAEELVRGRPHPMIDPRLRRERIAAAAVDPSVAVVLLDIVLGFGAADDPAGDIAGAIADAKRAARSRDAYLAVVASVTGTDDDPQIRSRQVHTLEAAGVVVLPTAARAALFAADLVHARSLAAGIAR